MENMGDTKIMMHELLQGMELARQLQAYLHMPSSSQETRDLLIQKIISTFEKVLEMVNWKGPVPAGESSLQHPLGAAIRMSDSPLSSTSPRSEDSDRDLKDRDPNTFKKRNTLPRWTKQIRVTPGIGVEGPLDDGYSWRKYGQKDILGAMYPRGYYRCTHRNVQGCMATKQVQRADEDPSIFEITYRGKHTCTMVNNVGSSSPIPPEKQEPILNNTNPQQQQNILQSLERQPDELLLSLRKGLRVQTENLDSPGQSSFIPFHFPLSTDIKIESQVFPSPVLENFTYSSHMSPDTSGISQSHFSVSPSGVNSFGGNPNINSESQINHMVPAITSAPISSTVPSEFPFDQLEFDGQNFTFDNPPFFS